MASAIWGWRLELCLGLSSLVVLAVAQAMSPVAPFLVVGMAVVALWRNPEARRGLQAKIQENREIRWLHAALWHCVVVGRNGSTPRVVRSSRLPVGRRYVISLPTGLHFEAIGGRSNELAAALGAREVRVRPIEQNARYVELAVIYENAFPSLIASPLLPRSSVSLWDPLPFGVGQDGLPVSLALVEHNLLIGGEPGSGKSVTLSSLAAAAALDPSVSLTLLDGKRVELAPWAQVAERMVGSDQEDAVTALDAIREIMDRRYATLAASRRRKLERDDLDGLHVVIVDELSFYLRGGKRETREQFAELLRDVVSRGRAAGIIVFASTQKPSHEVVPTWIRDLFSFRLAFRCTSPDASDTILGQGWASQGYSAATIDPSARGVGYLLAEGGVPTLVKTPFLDDSDIDRLALRAERLRRPA